MNFGYLAYIALCISFSGDTIGPLVGNHSVETIPSTWTIYGLCAFAFEANPKFTQRRQQIEDAYAALFLGGSLGRGAQFIQENVATSNLAKFVKTQVDERDLPS